MMTLNVSSEAKRGITSLAEPARVKLDKVAGQGKARQAVEQGRAR